MLIEEDKATSTSSCTDGFPTKFGQAWDQAPTGTRTALHLLQRGKAFTNVNPLYKQTVKPVAPTVKPVAPKVKQTVEPQALTRLKAGGIDIGKGRSKAFGGTPKPGPSPRSRADADADSKAGELLRLRTVEALTNLEI